MDMIGFLSVLRPAAGEPPGALSWWLITAGSDATKVNRWNPGAKHKRDNIGQAAGYPGSRDSRDPGLRCPRPGSGVLVPWFSARGAPLRPPREGRPAGARWECGERLRPSPPVQEHDGEARSCREQVPTDKCRAV